MKKSLGANPIALPAPLWCVGAYDKEGRANVMTIAWGGICCSKPPMLTVSIRPSRYTYECIMDRGAYTVSVPSANYTAEADYFGIATGKSTDKFADTGLTAEKAEFVDAPYVAEFPMVVECKLFKTVELGVHVQMIGEIMDVKVDAEALTEEGKLNPIAADPLVFAPNAQGYYRMGALAGDAFAIGKQFKK